MDLSRSFLKAGWVKPHNNLDNVSHFATSVRLEDETYWYSRGVYIFETITHVPTRSYFEAIKQEDNSWNIHYRLEPTKTKKDGWVHERYQMYRAFGFENGDAVKKLYFQAGESQRYDLGIPRDCKVRIRNDAIALCKKENMNLSLVASNLTFEQALTTMAACEQDIALPVKYYESLGFSTGYGSIHHGAAYYWLPEYEQLDIGTPEKTIGRFSLASILEITGRTAEPDFTRLAHYAPRLEVAEKEKAEQRARLKQREAMPA